MKKIILIIAFTLFIYAAKTQNIECVGNSISIPLSGYKAGSIQWQFSTNKNDWSYLIGKTETILQYTLTHSGYFRARIKYGQCDYYSDTTFINVYPVPTTANAGLDQSLTNNDTIVTLAANTPLIGKGKWTILLGVGGILTNDTVPNTTFKGNPCTDYVLRWSISSGCIDKIDDINIGFHLTPSVANAGIDQIISNNDTVVMLSANKPTQGKGKWSIVYGQGGVIENDTLQNTIFKGRSKSEYTLRWTISTKCQNSFDDIYVNFGSKVKDIDNNEYKIIQIGSQIWMVDNLRVTHFQNGESIQLVTDDNVWKSLSSSGYCNFNNTDKDLNLYGRLYNFYTVTDDRNLCPVGWHIASDNEWNTLFNYLGGKEIAGGKMKESGTIHWASPNTGATNESGFNILPSGYRDYSGFFISKGYATGFWSATERNSVEANVKYFYFSGSDVYLSEFKKGTGFSVRCIK